jgi:para-nitrobenzyl esterase
VAVLAFAGAARSADLLTVRTEAGLVHGIQQGTTRVFRSVPYAAPPVGNRRWAAPEPPDHWDGVRDATAFGNICIQGGWGGNPVFGDEDCLTLTLYVPAAAQKGSRLPVLFYNSNDYNTFTDGGQTDFFEFANRGVITVNVQYRIRNLGAFAHPLLTKAAPASRQTSACSIRAALCSGSTTTSPTSAATRATSR